MRRSSSAAAFGELAAPASAPRLGWKMKLSLPGPPSETGEPEEFAGGSKMSVPSLPSDANLKVTLAAKQQFGVGNADGVGVRGIGMDDRQTTAVAALSRGHVSHSPLPVALPIERERLAHPLASLRAVTLF